MVPIFAQNRSRSTWTNTVQVKNNFKYFQRGFSRKKYAIGKPARPHLLLRQPPSSKHYGGQESTMAVRKALWRTGKHYGGQAGRLAPPRCAPSRQARRGRIVGSSLTTITIW